MKELNSVWLVTYGLEAYEEVKVFRTFPSAKKFLLQMAYTLGITIPAKDISSIKDGSSFTDKLSWITIEKKGVWEEKQ